MGLMDGLKYTLYTIIIVVRYIDNIRTIYKISMWGCVGGSGDFQPALAAKSNYCFKIV